MKITINTDVLSRNGITLGEFLVLLIGYYDVDYAGTFNSLIKRKLIEANIFKRDSAVLSNNTRDFIASIIIQCDDKVMNDIKYEALARTLMKLYPDGIKSGTTYEWRGTVSEIVQKLRILTVKYNFGFTATEAMRAVRDYVDSFDGDFQRMRLLKYFILKTTKDEDGNREVESLFMSYIENNRENKENEEINSNK